MKIQNPKSRIQNQLGTSLIELLVAALIIAIAAGWSIATWSIMSRAPAAKRVTEMGAFVAQQEIERIKSQRFLSLNVGTTTSTTYYDKFGQPTAVVANYLYRADSTVSPIVNRDGIDNSEDLLQIYTVVKKPDGTGNYETARTMLTFGGL